MHRKTFPTVRLTGSTAELPEKPARLTNLLQKLIWRDVGIISQEFCYSKLDNREPIFLPNSMRWVSRDGNITYPFSSFWVCVHGDGCAHNEDI